MCTKYSFHCLDIYKTNCLNLFQVNTVITTKITVLGKAIKSIIKSIPLRDFRRWIIYLICSQLILTNIIYFSKILHAFYFGTEIKLWRSNLDCPHFHFNVISFSKFDENKMFFLETAEDSLKQRSRWCTQCRN